ncbi:MAG TPA: BTAD domain-containing putative transcriptional regulator, partial [Acidimicrobiales bacterium]|nr:BTAD domain-containing putative transcriptional regulator [Acidimicrobiales bacterium]
MRGWAAEAGGSVVENRGGAIEIRSSLVENRGRAVEIRSSPVEIGGRTWQVGRSRRENHMADNAEAAGLRFECRILGPLEVSVDGRAIELRRVKERTLLAALALRPNQVVSLNHLAAALWEDAEPPSPPATLRVHVSRLRQALASASEGAEQVVVTSTQGYKLEVASEAVDAWRFEQKAALGRRQLSEGDPEAASTSFQLALAEWRDRVLTDLPYSQALMPEMVRLEEARLSTIEDKVDAELRRGRHHELVGELDQLVAETPLRERLWALRMVALYRSGRQAEALRAYGELRVLLREELGIHPSPALQQLERAILDQDPNLESQVVLGADARDTGHPTTRAVSRPEIQKDSDRPAFKFPARLIPPAEPAFSGRSAQLDAIKGAWDSAREGGCRVVLVSGEAGVGKTRLVAEAAMGAYDGGGVVLFGRCDEDMGVPFQPFVEALDQTVQSVESAQLLGRHAGELARLLPELPQLIAGLEPPMKADPETERYRLFDAVASWLEAVSSDSGVFLVLDDLHCAEKPTLLLLRHLVRSAKSMRILIVGTYRDTDLDRSHPLTEMLADLRREPGVERFALSGLDVTDVREMLASEEEGVDERAAELTRVVWSQANGNPFFVSELLRSLVESRRLVERNGMWTTDFAASDLEIPEGVREVVGRRLSRLSETAQAVLALTAVIGAVLDFDVLVGISGLKEDAVLDALDEATTASLLRETSSGSYEFSHALVRSTLYDEQSAVRRARRHRQVAEALEARGGEDTAALAYHFQRAGGADARAVDYAAAAGEQALEQLAFDQAAEFFTQALDAAEDVDAGLERRCSLLVRLGTAQRLAGISAYRATLLEAARLAMNLGDATLLAQAALANNRGLPSAAGMLDNERIFVIEAALDAVGPEDSPVRARLLSLHAVELVWGDPELRRLAIAQEAVEMARRLEDESCLLDVWTSAHISSSVADQIPTLVSELPELIELAERIGDPQKLAMACGSGIVHYLEVGDLSESDEMVERISRLAQDVGNPFFRWMEANARCSRMTVSGTGDEIEKAASVALEIGQETGQPDTFAWFAPQIFVARWSQGRLGEIVDLVRQVLRETPGVPAWNATLALALACSG